MSYGAVLSAPSDMGQTGLPHFATLVKCPQRSYFWTNSDCIWSWGWLMVKKVVWGCSVSTLWDFVKSADGADTSAPFHEISWVCPRLLIFVNNHFRGSRGLLMVEKNYYCKVRALYCCRKSGQLVHVCGWQEVVGVILTLDPNSKGFLPQGPLKEPFSVHNLDLQLIRHMLTNPTGFDVL